MYMPRKCVAYIHSGIPFSHEEEGNPVIYNNMNKPWRCGAKCNKQMWKDKGHMLPLLCGIWRAELTEDRMVVTRGWVVVRGVEDSGAVGQRGKISAARKCKVQGSVCLLQFIFYPGHESC